MWETIKNALAWFFNTLIQVQFPWITAGIAMFVSKTRDWVGFLRTSKVALYTALTGIIVAIGAGWDYVLRKIGDYRQAIQSVRSGVGGQTLDFAQSAGQVMDFANYFAPVNEFIVCTGILITCYLAAVIVRSIKSWIPTVS